MPAQTGSQQGGRAAGSGAPVVAEGAAELRRLAPELAALADRTGAPVSARPEWQLAWAETHPGQPPTVLGIRRSGDLAAAAVLGVRRRGPLARVTGYPSSETDRLRLSAVDGHAAEALAAHLTRWLATLRGPWVLRLEQLPPDDAAAGALVGLLRLAEEAPGDPCPYVRLEPGRTYGTKNVRKDVGYGTRRAEREGFALTFATHRDPGAIAPLLDRAAAVRRSRDHNAGRVSGIDRDEDEQFWRRVVLEHARRGEAELWVLMAGEEMAAYDVGLIDGTTYRLWDGRFDPRFSRCYPGLLLDAAVLHAASDAGHERFDLGRGATSFKLRWADEVEQTAELRAWSSRAARLLDDGPRRARERLAAWLDADPRRRALYRRAKGALLWRGERGKGE